MSYTYSLTIPGTIYIVSEHSIVSNDDWPVARRIKTHSVALVIAAGIAGRENQSYCIVQGRDTKSTEIGWVSNDDLLSVACFDD